MKGLSNHFLCYTAKLKTSSISSITRAARESGNSWRKHSSAYNQGRETRKHKTRHRRQQSIKIKQEVANRRQRHENSGVATLHRNTKKKTVFIFKKNKTVRTSIVQTSGTILVKVL